MECYDYRSNDLLGAARYAAIYSDGFDDGADEPSPGELQDEGGPLYGAILLCPACQHFREHGWTEGECLCGEVEAAELDPGLLAVFDEVYGAETVAATDLPF